MDYCHQRSHFPGLILLPPPSPSPPPSTPHPKIFFVFPVHIAPLGGGGGLHDDPLPSPKDWRNWVLFGGLQFEDPPSPSLSARQTFGQLLRAIMLQKLWCNSCPCPPDALLRQLHGSTTLVSPGQVIVLLSAVIQQTKFCKPEEIWLGHSLSSLVAPNESCRSGSNPHTKKPTRSRTKREYAGSIVVGKIESREK